MADRFQLRVITPTSEAVNEAVFEVTAPGTVGEFGILPDHAEFLSSLEIGVIRYRVPAGERRIAVREGFAEVSANVMTVLSEVAVASADPAVATADLQQARAKLADLSIFDEGYAEADADRRWAEARLSLGK
jgi:F-type H+-transporting ATPase subunit epsilon